MRILIAAVLVGLCLSNQIAHSAESTHVIFDLKKSPQVVSAILGDLDAKSVRASVTLGANFPLPNSQWRGAGEVVGSSAAVQSYYKVWKGDLDDIAIGRPAVLVYQQPVRVSDGYGGHRFELRDINVATDFNLKRSAKAIRLEVLTWYQFPSGARRKLSVQTVRRDEAQLNRRLATSKQAAAAVSQLESQLAAIKQQATSSGTADSVRAGAAATQVRGAEKRLQKAKSLASESNRLEQALGIVPNIILFGDQMHERADFTVAFSAENGGRQVNLVPDE